MDQAAGPDASSSSKEHERSKPGWIVIARHGRPKADRSLMLTWREYEAWWAQYEMDGLAAGQQPPPRLVAVSRDGHAVFASTRPRALETARAVMGDRQIIADATFVEAPLPPPRLAGRRKPGHWGVWARVSWWLGRANGHESRQQAEARANAAAAILIARATTGENVVLFAHGWFNRMLRPVLRAAGWRCVEDGGDAYWSFRKYEKR